MVPGIVVGMGPAEGMVGAGYGYGKGLVGDW